MAFDSEALVKGGVWVMREAEGGVGDGGGDGEVLGDCVAVDKVVIADCDVEGVKKDVVGEVEGGSEDGEVALGRADTREASFLFTSV